MSYSEIAKTLQKLNEAFGDDQITNDIELIQDVKQKRNELEIKMDSNKKDIINVKNGIEYIPKLIKK